MSRAATPGGLRAIVPRWQSFSSAAGGGGLGSGAAVSLVACMQDVVTLGTADSATRRKSSPRAHARRRRRQSTYPDQGGSWWNARSDGWSMLVGACRIQCSRLVPAPHGATMRVLVARCASVSDGMSLTHAQEHCWTAVSGHNRKGLRMRLPGDRTRSCKLYSAPVLCCCAAVQCPRVGRTRKISCTDGYGDVCVCIAM